MESTLAQTGRTAVGLPVQGAARRTRLYLEGVEAPVVTRIRRRTSDRLTVSQALPFLALQNHVYDEGMRLGRIAAVDLTLDGGTPELVIELVYDSDILGDDHARDTVPGTTEAPTSAPRRDPTLSFEREGGMVRCEVSVGSDRPRSDEPTVVFRTGADPDEAESVVPVERALLSRAMVRLSAWVRLGLSPEVRRRLREAMRLLRQQVTAALLRRASRLLTPRLP